MYPSGPIVTFVRPAATAWLLAVVNAGQLNCSVPEPGNPLARYTVPCTVVVVNPCAVAPLASKALIKSPGWRLATLPAGLRERALEIAHSPRWRGDGKELFFVSPDGEVMAVDITLDPVFFAGVPHRLFSADPTDLANYDVRPDGQRFLIFMRQRGTQDAPITVVLNWWAELRQEP